jgi:tRNA-modifying protein YgfZ
MSRSALLLLPGAVAGSGIDAPVAWHYGDPMREQRVAERSAGLVDRTHREVVSVTGPARLTWLNTLTSQLLLELADGATTEALILTPTGHVEHHFGVTDLGGTTYLDTEPGRGAALLAYLEKMKFWTEVDLAMSPLRQLSILGPSAPTDLSPGLAAATDGGFTRRTSRQVDIFTTDPGKAAAELIAGGVVPIGSWADDALRVPSRQPRIGVDNDERTIPNELRWLNDAVHLSKGCYRGQETVARVANLGRPPRRLVMLNLDGSQDVLPAAGDSVTTSDGRGVGRVGTVAQHYEDGPIALALVKRSILTAGVPLLAGGVDARVDPADLIVDDARPQSVRRGDFLDLRRN